MLSSFRDAAGWNTFPTKKRSACRYCGRGRYWVAHAVTKSVTVSRPRGWKRPCFELGRSVRLAAKGGRS
jgi:hypothetical protein